MKNPARVFSLLLVGAMFIAACGDDDAPTTSADANGEDPTETPEGENVSGGAADDGATVVKVGFHNLEGGAEFSLPDIRRGFEMGVDYVNAELEGINGHPMEAVTCNVDLTPESSVNCANRFVEEGVVAAVQGTNFLADAMLPILQGANIVEFVFVPLGPAEAAAQGDVYALADSTEGGFAAGLVHLQKEGSSKIVQVLADVPAMHAAASDIIEPVAERLGVDVEIVFYPQPADWSTVAATILLEDPDGVTMFAAEPDCLAAIPAIRSAGFSGPLIAGVCTQFIEDGDPSVLENVVVGSNFYESTMPSVPEDVQADLDTFDRYLEQNPDITEIRQAQQGFYMAVQVADVMRQISSDELTAEAVHDGAASASGDIVFREETYDCSSPSWPGSVSCTSGTIYQSITPDGEREPLPDQPVDLTPALPRS